MSVLPKMPKSTRSNTSGRGSNERSRADILILLGPEQGVNLELPELEKFLSCSIQVSGFIDPTQAERLREEDGFPIFSCIRDALRAFPESLLIYDNAFLKMADSPDDNLIMTAGEGEETWQE
ncbi:hypothetical protein ROLI_042530 [Roseobacter fucihabitans]|uniref:Uncharacterized protein n=1 Tax=Roseobacter fucihabitans TaxID=1537242 RepID=A0ABZ2BZ52_9RHOB|nr:hypothetical protein [Roseobacter litoralis]MBC6968156.1 hypothetical protein [Roseobacter litoralis]